MTPKRKTKSKDFESDLKELEKMVKQLEAGDLSLKEALKLYERGVSLSRSCHEQLEEAERRIEVLDERGELKQVADDLTDTDDPS